jgi:acetolactate synthase-1/2/3 large subunit
LFDDRVTGKLDEFASKAKVIHLDIDPAEVGKNRAPDVPIVGDVRVVLEQILHKAREFDYPTNPRSQPSLVSRDRALAARLSPASTLTGRQTFPQEVIVEVGRQAPTPTIPPMPASIRCGRPILKKSPDVGFLAWDWGRWVSVYRLAMGVKVAIPDEEVICISGDSSFQMNLQELATLTQFNIHAKTIIINNGWQGMVRQWQEAFYGERYSNSNMEVGMPDMELLAQVLRH